MSVSTIIDNAKDAQYITDIYRISGRIFNAGMPNNLPRLIYCVRKSVEWLYNQDQDDSTLIPTSNYLKALTVQYWLPCRPGSGNSLTGGGAGSAPVTGAAPAPDPYDFEVTGSSFIIAGQGVKTINSFIGYNVAFNRNNIPQSTVNMGGSYFTWNKETGLFQCVPAAAAGELFTISPL